MTPREGAFVGGLIGLAGGGALGLIAKRMIRGNKDIQALAFTGTTALGTAVGAVVGAGTCPVCPPPTPQVSPRAGAFVGGILGLAGGGLAGLAGQRMIKGNSDLKALTMMGVTLLGTYTGAIIGAGSCPACATLPPATNTNVPASAGVPVNTAQQPTPPSYTATAQ